MRQMVSARIERLFSSRLLAASIETVRALVTLWREPKGLDSWRPINKLSVDHFVDSTNFMFDRGQLRSRLGTKLLGNGAASTVLQTTDLARPNGKKVTIRFCLRHIEIFEYISEIWRVFPLDLHGSVDDFFTWTSWGDKLLFSNFVDGLWELDFQSYIIQKVSAAPGAKHLTVFGNRVIATAVNSFSKFLPYRVQWSVKNNYLDWTGLGSGFEDMYGAPGGAVDEAMATIPMTDEAAFVLRARTVWQMSVSGFADAPFRFSRIVVTGCPHRYSIAETQRGVVYLGVDSVYMLGIGQFQDIGQTAFVRIKERFSDLRRSYAVYDTARDEYRVAEGETVFRYRWREQGWTMDEYPVAIKSLGHQLKGKAGYPIDSLVGIIDDLVGTIDELVADRQGDDKIYIVPDEASATLTEFDPEDDPVQDMLADGTVVNTPLEIISGIVNLDPLEATETLELHNEYESFELQDLRYALSIDGGYNFTDIVTKGAPVSSGSEIHRVHLAQASRKAQFRIQSDTLGKLTLLGLTPAAVKVQRAS